MSLNDKFNHTTSTKLKNVVGLKNYIIDIVDNDQEIKRLCRYLTKTPLEDYGQDYNGKTIKQDDLVDTLKSDTMENCSTLTQILIPYMFNDEMPEIEQQVLIFIHNQRNNLNRLIGGNTIKVDIVCPRLYNELDDFGSERIIEIASRIIDLVDGSYVTEEYHDLLGASKFTVDGDGTMWRISKKSNALCYTFSIVADTINTRVK